LTENNHEDVRLLLDDGPLFAVWKPAGLATQAPAEFPSLEARMKAWLRAREGKEGNVYLGVPQRLDRPVSGVILFTRHVRAARKVSDQFERRQVSKTYWACVEGIVSPAEGTWTDRLKKIYGKPRTEVVGPDDPDGREAVLNYRTLGTWRRLGTSQELGDAPTSGPREGSWLEIDLETGRTHQIRIQAASRGHAIVGDAFYGATSTFGEPGLEERERPIALHARRIQLRHPMTGTPLDITAPLPETWRELGLPLSDADFLATT
jgi:23S rRNA pseudouridine1911/1915/1917 synthase